MTKAEMIEKAERLEERAADIRKGTAVGVARAPYTCIDPLWEGFARANEDRARAFREAAA